jgi:hypothetical protein
MLTVAELLVCAHKARLLRGLNNSG